MKALFIGQSYIDITFLADELPTGDAKTVARDYAVAFGGNAVTAAFCCAKLGIAPDLMASVADDWLGRMFVDMAAKYSISIHHRKVAQSSLSFIMPKGGQRAIVRCRDDNFRHPFPVLNLAGCRALHVDGHLADAAIHYAKICHEAGILTSLDGGGLRSNTHDLLGFISAAVVAERLCEQMKLTPGEMLTYLRSRGCKVGAVTMGSRGMLWYDESKTERFMPALSIPDDKVIDTNGAGDIFHGAYMYSYLVDPDVGWEQHFKFARAASSYAIQHLGNEASLPTLAQINETAARFDVPAHQPGRARSRVGRLERRQGHAAGGAAPLKTRTDRPGAVERAPAMWVSLVGVWDEVPSAFVQRPQPGTGGSVNAIDSGAALSTTNNGGCPCSSPASTYARKRPSGTASPVPSSRWRPALARACRSCRRHGARRASAAPVAAGSAGAIP